MDMIQIHQRTQSYKFSKGKMAKYYIIATRKSKVYPNEVSEIEAYGIHIETDQLRKWIYKPYTKADFFAKHWSSTNEYWTYNANTKESSLTYRRELTAGKPFLQSVSDKEKSDNLVNLPDM